MLILSSSLAQIAGRVEDFSSSLSLPLVGTTIKTKNGKIDLTVVDSLLHRLQYSGDPDDTLTVAKILASGIGTTTSIGSIVKALEDNRKALQGAGITHPDVGSSYDFALNWTTEKLSFTLSLREYTGFGTDRNLLGTAGPIVREFSDFQCPYCKETFDKVLPQLKKDWITAGKARLSYRQFPLESIHPNALPHALGSECAAQQGKFFAYHDLAFQNSAKVKPEVQATTLKLDLTKFKTCLSSAQTLAAVRSDIAIGTKLGVGGTPTVFVGPYLVEDPYDVDNYVRLLKLATAVERAKIPTPKP